MNDDLKQAAAEGFMDSFRLAGALVGALVMAVVSVFAAFVHHKSMGLRETVAREAPRSDSQFMRG